MEGRRVRAGEVGAGVGGAEGEGWGWTEDGDGGWGVEGGGTGGRERMGGEVPLGLQGPPSLPPSCRAVNKRGDVRRC